jgi:hypothetical protein
MFFGDFPQHLNDEIGGFKTSRFGDGSIPIHTIFRGMNIHESQPF